MIVSVKNLSKSYGSKRVVDDVSFDVRQGEIVGIVGKNGAGKTTIMKAMLGIIPNYEGEITLFEGDASKRTDVGSLLEEPGFFGFMTGYQNLIYYAKVFGIENPREEVERLLRLVKLYDARNKKTKKYSLGMKQRLALALALMNNPSLLVLDEPINGIDPEGIVEIRNMLSRIAKEEGRAIVISSHILSELETLCDTFLLLDEGKVVNVLSSKEGAKPGERVISLVTSDDEKAAALLKEKYSVVATPTLMVLDDVNPVDVILLLHRAEIEVFEISKKRKTLEEQYMNLLGGKHDA